MVEFGFILNTTTSFNISSMWHNIYDNKGVTIFIYLEMIGLDDVFIKLNLIDNIRTFG